jgi:hypothetical protein
MGRRARVMMGASQFKDLMFHRWPDQTWPLGGPEAYSRRRYRLLSAFGDFHLDALSQF